MAKAPPSIAATSTLAMVRAAGACGIETADVLAGAGLTLQSLENPDARLPGPTVIAIWTALRERTDDPTLQLTAPSTLPFGAYRVIDYLVASSATVGDGVGRFARFFGLIADAVDLTIGRLGDAHFLRLQMADGGAVPAVYVDYVFAALVGRIRMRIRPDFQIRRLELRQPQPPLADRYTQLFRAPIQFGAAEDRLFIDDVEWEAPMVTADSALVTLLEEHARLLSERIPRAPGGFTADVQKAIAAVLPEGGSAAAVARALHVSVRTLQRRLVETGTSFSALYDDVRGRLAVEYLSDPAVSIAEVAFLLGFSEQSSFNRAFRRWTGQTPGRWRRNRA